MVANDNGKAQPRPSAELWGMPRWIWGVTFVWLGLMAVLVWYSTPCTEAAPGWSPLARYVTCRQINEIGDFLAGAFAPLAFFFLVATVQIQSRELRLQRYELEMTREVTKAQVEEVKKQAEQAAAQTAVLQEQLLASQTARYDEMFDAAVADIVAWARHSFSRTFHLSTSTKPRPIECQGIASNLPDDPAFAVRRLCMRLGAVAEKLAELRRDDPLAKTTLSPDHCSELHVRLDRLLDVVGQCSHGKAQEIGVSELAEAVDHARALNVSDQQERQL